MHTKQWKPVKRTRRSSFSRKRYPTAHLVLVAASVPVVLAIAAVGIFVVMPRMRSHAMGLANPNMNCTLLVPANPLSARGLATPYQLSATDAALGPCNENNPNQSAFVQAVIYDLHTGKLSTYNPLVIDQGTDPLVAPIVPKLPGDAVVGLWFGFNATNLLLQGATPNTLRKAGCINGLGQSLFTQFAYCNAHTFYEAVNRGIAAGLVRVPRLGMAKDGLPCPTTRDFSVIDQDQSDNVQTTYLANADGLIAQFSAANQANFPEATLIANPSDNRLLSSFLDPTLGCQPWLIPDLTNNNALVATMATDELQAQSRQRVPVALIPDNDPMTVILDDAGNAKVSLAKTNLYRRGVDQEQVGADAQASGTAYCRKFLTIGLPRVKLDEPMTLNGPTPFPAMATDLFTFLAMRANQSWTNLGCQNLLGMGNPVTLTMDLNGVVTSATINTMPVAATPTPMATAAMPTPTATGATPTPTATAVPATPTPTTGNGGVQQLTTGSAHIMLDATDGLALMAWNITYPNHATQQIMVSVVRDSCTGAAIFNQPATTNGNSQTQSFGVITGLQGVQALPANWFLTVTDPIAGGIVGCSPIAVSGTQGTTALKQSM